MSERLTVVGILDEAERQVFWKMRKAAFPAMGRVSSHYYVQDSVIPRTALADVLDRIDELAREYDLQVANVFHAGDGNLHPLVCYDGAVDGEAERAEELSGLIIDACLDAGGSITGEHGVGIDKKKHMPKMFGEEDLDAFQRLRCAFDPAGLANPGKLMPTPRLCGEVPGRRRAPHPAVVAGQAEIFLYGHRTGLGLRRPPGSRRRLPVAHRRHGPYPPGDAARPGARPGARVDQRQAPPHQRARQSQRLDRPRLGLDRFQRHPDVRRRPDRGPP